MAVAMGKIRTFLAGGLPRINYKRYFTHMLYLPAKSLIPGGMPMSPIVTNPAVA
jgi:hypothetical protein